MPLYFGSDNKIYDSDLDGSTAYAGNTADYKSINSYDYANILKFYSKNNNQNIFFDNSTTSGFSVSRKNYIFGSKEEKTYHFTNLVNNYINKQISLLNYNPNTVETYLNSTTQGFTSDAIAIINWKNNLENKRDQAIDNFMSGITDGLPLLQEFIKQNGTTFSSLGFYRGGNFSRPSNISNREIELMGAVINEGLSGYGGCTCQADYLQTITPDIITTTSIFGSYDYCIPTEYSFPESFIDDSQNLNQTDFGIKYFRGGTTENLGCPIFRMIKNESGTTSEVYIALTPDDYSDQTKGINPLEYAVDGGNLLDFYEQIKDKTGFNKNGCASLDESLSGDIYDPITNPCGIISWSCLCTFSSEFNGEISRKLYDDSANARANFSPCETPIDPRFPLPRKPVQPSLQTKNDLRLSTPPTLLWQEDESLDARDIDETYDGWKAPNYSGALNKCRSSGTIGVDPYWHGLTSGRTCSTCIEEYACYVNAGIKTESFDLSYIGSICRTKSEPYNPEFPNNPIQYIECLDFNFVFSGFLQTSCSYETSCECGCNPTCCLCLCASNHDDDFAPQVPRCTGGTCAYETREVDIVFPTINTDINQIIDDSI